MATQLTLSFDPGLADRHRSLKGCLRERVYANQRPLKALAADMDLSESELSRKLSENPNDTRDVSLDDLEAYMKATGDTAPIFYLIEKYAVSLEAKQAYAAAELAKQLPQIIALARQLGVKG